MIGMDVKLLFFDRQAVTGRVDKATRKVLGHFGALVRKSAIASIKEAPTTRHASTGSPPFSHMSAKRRKINQRRKAEGKQPVRGGFKGLKHILYAFEPVKRSVVIGPASNRSRAITIPEILEYGKLDVSRHPFMGPAFEQQKPKLPSLWANSVK